MDKKLKNCPFCNAEAKVIYEIWAHAIHKEGCPFYYEEDEGGYTLSIVEWETRPIEHELNSYKWQIENNKEFRERCKDEARKRVEKRGGEYGNFWVKYRDETPTPNMEFEDAVAMVLEVLNREGVTAWSGDATYIVAELIYKQYKEKKRLLNIAAQQFEAIEKVNTLEGAYFHASYALEQINEI